MNTYNLLDDCIRIERILGEIYRIFMTQQASSPEHAALWDKTAQEEHNHEQQFQLAKRLSCSMKTDVTNVPHPPKELIERLERLKQRAAGVPLSPAASIRLAIDLEKRLADFHMNRMDIFAEASANTLFRSMMKHDHEHIDALEHAFLSWHGTTAG